VTKLSRLELQSDHTKHAENFRKLVLAMSNDIRVLLVKLADRLHNMQTLDHIRDMEKRKRIARETLEIYAPLSERIGMHQMKDELENLAFAQLHQEARDSIVQRLTFLRESGQPRADRIIAELKRTLKEEGVEAAVSGREKTPYSIWRKMQRKNVPFEQLSDITAFRIVVDNVPDCYRALGVLHSAYSMVPGRFKDFISTPKPNGYQSLHTGVIGPEKQRIEIQIRTPEMHEVADFGVAAHWRYKQGGGAGPVDGRQYRWLRELLDILEHAAGPEEFLEHTKLEMFQDQVFCFTPKGDLIALPRGATPVDFAYAVHSEVGNTCVGAKINGRHMPLRSQLHNGDQVEIVTSRAQTPSPTWERFVVTGKARACIRRFIRTQQRAQYIELGRAMIQKEFQHEGYEYADKSLDGVLKKFKAEDTGDLLAQIGEGLLGAREVVNAIFPGTRAKTPDKVVSLNRQRAKTAKGSYAIPIRGLIPGMAMHFAGCCHPLPGDRIVGIVTTGKGVTIHTIDCETLESFAETPERWLDVAWDQDPNSTEQHVGRLSVVITNQPGSLGSLTTVIGKNLGNISNLKITNRSIDFFEVLVDVEVKDVRHLTNIIAALRATPAISSVDRARG
jgi:GTP pyrophosphokinase